MGFDRGQLDSSNRRADLIANYAFQLRDDIASADARHQLRPIRYVLADLRRSSGLIPKQNPSVEGQLHHHPLAIDVEVEGDIGASVIFAIQDLREGELLGSEMGSERYSDPDEFRAKHLERCDS